MALVGSGLGWAQQDPASPFPSPWYLGVGRAALPTGAFSQTGAGQALCVHKLRVETRGPVSPGPGLSTWTQLGPGVVPFPRSCEYEPP